MRIILSRKGFDTGCGGCPSPYFVDEGKLFSLPIPSDCNFYSYNDLRFNNEQSCFEIMEQLNIKARSCKAHTDPDIRPDLFYSRDSDWIPRFGQQGNSQKHLAKQGVEKDDVFLFYGLFQDVKYINGKPHFIPNTKKQIIWGYMQIGCEPIRVTSNPFGCHHPHFYNSEEYEMNTVYIGAEKLSFEPTVAGYGTFDFDESLVLSRECGETADVYNVLKLPEHFYEHRMTGNADWRWKKENGNCILTMAKRGQEFIITNDTANHDAESWAKNLILSNIK